MQLTAAATQIATTLQISFTKNQSHTNSITHKHTDDDGGLPAPAIVMVHHRFMISSIKFGTDESEWVWGNDVKFDAMGGLKGVCGWVEGRYMQ